MNLIVQMEHLDLEPHKFMKEHSYQETPITFAFQHLKRTKEALNSALTAIRQLRIRVRIAVVQHSYAIKTR